MAGAADVFEGTVIATGERVAVKRLRLNIGGDEQIAKVRIHFRSGIIKRLIPMQNIAREIRIWSEFDHPNIQPLLGYCIEGDYPSLVSRWIAKGSLREYMTHLDKNLRRQSQW